MLSPEQRTLQARIAASKRHHPDVYTGYLEQELRASRVADHITQLVNAAPPLTNAQRKRLADLLAPARQTR